MTESILQTLAKIPPFFKQLRVDNERRDVTHRASGNIFAIEEHKRRGDPHGKVEGLTANLHRIQTAASDPEP